MAELLRRAAKEYGWTADQVWSHTPTTLVTLFARLPQSKPSSALPDRDELLREHNQRRAKKGLYPTAPSWFLPGLRSKRV